jgi:hypothetical protein
MAAAARNLLIIAYLISVNSALSVVKDGCPRFP